MKKNKTFNYFLNITPFTVLSIIIIVAGFLIWWYAFEIWMIGTPIAIFGAVCLFICLTKKVTDEDYAKSFTEKIKELNSDRDIDYVPDYTFDEYILDDAKYSKTDKNNIIRTEKMIHTDIFFEKNIFAVEYCFVDISEETFEKKRYEFSYATLKTAVNERQSSANKHSKKVTEMIFSGEGAGECVIPVKNNSVEPDEIIQKIERIKQKLR